MGTSLKWNFHSLSTLPFLKGFIFFSSSNFAGVVTIGPNLGPSHPSNPLNTLNIFASAESLLQRSLLMMMKDDYDDEGWLWWWQIKDESWWCWWWWWKMMMMKDEDDDGAFASGSLTTSALLFLSSQGLDFNILLFHNRPIYTICAWSTKVWISINFKSIIFPPPSMPYDYERSKTENPAYYHHHTHHHPQHHHHHHHDVHHDYQVLMLPPPCESTGALWRAQKKIFFNINTTILIIIPLIILLIIIPLIILIIILLLLITTMIIIIIRSLCCLHRAKALVPYDEHGRRCTGEKMWLNLQVTTIIIINIINLQVTIITILVIITTVHLKRLGSEWNWQVGTTMLPFLLTLPLPRSLRSIEIK